MYKDNMKTPSLVFQMVKNPPTSSGEAGSSPGSGRSREEGNGYPPQYSCWKFQGQRSLAGYSPRGHRESDTTEQLTIMTKAKQIVLFSFHVPFVLAEKHMTLLSTYDNKDKIGCQCA